MFSTEKASVIKEKIVVSSIQNKSAPVMLKLEFAVKSSVEKDILVPANSMQEAIAVDTKPANICIENKT